MNATHGLVVSTSFCLILSMICSLLEAALYAVPISLTRPRAEEGLKSWQLLLRLKENPDRPIAGILITNTVANTAGAALAGYFAKEVFDSWGVAVFAVALVLAILYFSEIIPKTIGYVFAARLGPIVAWPIQGLVLSLYPFIRVIEYSTAIIKRWGGDIPTITEMELASLARQGAQEGQIHRHEAQLIEHVLRLDTVRARDLMTPRTVVELAAEDMPLSQVQSEAMRWRHSRLLVHRSGQPDDIYGFCRRREVFDALANGESGSKTIGDFTSPIKVVPEGASAHVLLDQFLDSRQHISAVIDEFGSFVGLVTLEDVIECLLGREIVDEYDVHADMQIFARDQARRRGLPIGPGAGEKPASGATEEPASGEKNEK